MSKHIGARSRAHASRLAAAGLTVFLSFGFTGVAHADQGGIPNGGDGTTPTEICHNGQTITVDAASLPVHLAHLAKGQDKLGPCSTDSNPPGDGDTTQPDPACDADELTAAPACEETTPPVEPDPECDADEATEAPDCDVTTPPKDEDTTPPKDEDTTPPKDEDTTPPKDGDTTVPPKGDDSTNPPKDDDNTPPAGGGTNPPKDDTTNPPKGEGGSKPGGQDGGGKPGHGSKPGQVEDGDDILGEDAQRPGEKGDAPAKSKGGLVVNGQVLAADTRRPSRPAAVVLPATGASENMALETGAGLFLVLAGGLTLFGRRRTSKI